jgi:hypothetical protein
VTIPGDSQMSGSINVFGSDGHAFAMPVVNGVGTLATSAMAPGQSFNLVFAGNDKYRSSSKLVWYTITDVPAATGPTALYLITPCRLIDTRDANSPVYADQSDRAVYVARRCGIPAGAKAIAANVTVVNPAGGGYLTLYPSASAIPATSTINYRAAKTRANNAVLPLSAGGMLNVHNSGPAVHVILDVTGYFQ